LLRKRRFRVILESLITDESKLTLDCVKALLVQGTKISIADEMYWNPEVQAAIKLGKVRVQGEPPAAETAPTQAVEEFRILKNVSPYLIALDCIKDYATPNGGQVQVPVGMLKHLEVATAMKNGWLVDPNGPKEEAAPEAAPQLSEEEQKIVAARSRKTAKPTADAPIKAKKISAHDDVEVSEEEEGNELFVESKTLDVGARNKKGPSVQPEPIEVNLADKEEIGPDDLFDLWKKE
jgi:hypothetical protein